MAVTNHSDITVPIHINKFIKFYQNYWKSNKQFFYQNIYSFTGQDIFITSQWFITCEEISIYDQYVLISLPFGLFISLYQTQAIL